jgi:DNA-binding XRE family transcriptional regulator
VLLNRSTAGSPHADRTQQERDLQCEVSLLLASAYGRGPQVPREFSGQRLRKLRLTAGLKPEHIAIRIDRSTYSVREYELGRVTPSTEIVGKLADLFDCPVDDLFIATDAPMGAAA